MRRACSHSLCTKRTVSKRRKPGAWPMTIISRRPFALTGCFLDPDLFAMLVQSAPGAAATALAHRAGGKPHLYFRHVLRVDSFSRSLRGEVSGSWNL